MIISLKASWLICDLESLFFQHVIFSKGVYGERSWGERRIFMIWQVVCVAFTMCRGWMRVDIMLYPRNLISWGCLEAVRTLNLSGVSHLYFQTWSHFSWVQILALSFSCPVTQSSFLNSLCLICKIEMVVRLPTIY